jgi:hypothetical protein
LREPSEDNRRCHRLSLSPLRGCLPHRSRRTKWRSSADKGAPTSCMAPALGERSEVECGESNAVDKVNHHLFRFAVVTRCEDNSTGLIGEKSCIQTVGMVHSDFTSLAPTAISATISLDVRAFNAARDLVTPSRRCPEQRPMSVCGIDQNSAAPIDTFPRIGHVHRVCSENNHVAFSCLLLRPCTSVRAKIGDTICKCLWPSGFGYDDVMTGSQEITSKRTRYLTCTYKPDFHDESPLFCWMAS